ncbi:hypothetical protein BC939DRAFT_457248 [Gamsiella multidivaricata]|uniref:uncharacterized protein n=1 Tax=Gamsiella multidivaricata TaxID=101098 RepID=UPI0022211A79|nr:uncharacterized protein BC939DRAFT_457248 [Gamsiella multidivaricata]KAG0369945.1 hypothetical protein BGZ54_008340 [Gamsiella multidivaricata]KAI7820648.1 hypothetical protein BC939DRAFT_457248 [Gamsiella multidivaricata]
MAASVDTIANTGLQCQDRSYQPPQRSSRSASTLASLRTSFSKVSIQGQQRPHQPLYNNDDQYSTTTSASSTTPAMMASPSSDPRQHKSPRDYHESKPALPLLQIPFSKQHEIKHAHSQPATKTETKDGGDDGYFGDILDKYCHSDEDPISPSTASPTSPFSTAPDFRAPMPPTPPVTLSRHQRHQNQSIVPPQRATPLRNSIVPQSDRSSVESSPMLAASARFSAYLNSTSNRASRDSLPLTGTASSSPSPSPILRAYTKRPVPIPDSLSAANAAASPRTSVASMVSSQGRSRSASDLQVSGPEPPPKDSARQLLHAQHRNSSNPQVPQRSNTFPAVVEEAMRRDRAVSLSSFASSSGDISPYAENAIIRGRSNSSQSQLSYLTPKSRDRYSNQQHPQQQKQQLLYFPGQNGTISSIPRSQVNEERLYYQQQQQQQQQHYDYQQQRLSQQQSPPHSPHTSAALTPSEMLSRRFDDRARTIDQVPTPAPSKYAATGGMKSALVKTPIAHTRSSETLGRTVIFGDMITVVTVERTETPPPPPVNKKGKKKKSKKGSSKAGPHPDPEYDSDYYNAPYTPEPAEVVVTQAPWIGNPNYDEERANSRFYIEDDYDPEYDDYEYVPPRGLSPENEGDDEEDEDENDGYGNGNESPPKKKGGIFKFKRAVNRLLRN